MDSLSDYTNPMAALSDGVVTVDDDEGTIDNYVAPGGGIDDVNDDKDKLNPPVPKPEPKPEPTPDPEPDPEPNVPSEVDELVPEFFSVLNEKWGLEIAEDQVPKTIEEFTDMMDSIIAANIKHEFYNEESEIFDKFLRDGGDPRIFMQSSGARKMVEALDMEEVADQKLALEMYYEKKGLDQDEIKKAISKSEKLGELADDAKEVIPKLQKITQTEQAELVKKQSAIEFERQQSIAKFNNDLVAGVKSIKSIFGMELTTAQKQELLPYITQVDANGRTPQMNDYFADPVMYNIVTAFAWKHKDDILEMMGAPAKDQAISNFRKKQKEIADKRKQTSDHNPDGGADDAFLLTAKRVEKKD